LKNLQIAGSIKIIKALSSFLSDMIKKNISDFLILFPFLLLLTVTSVYPARDVKPLCIKISREHPLIIMMAPALGRTSPENIGQEIVDAWFHHYPDELKPYTTIHIEERVLDYDERMARFRDILDTVSEHDIPIVLQIADPDNQYTMPLDYVEQLLREYPVIKGLNLAEMDLEHYSSFGAELKYKLKPETAHLIDAIKLAAKYGRFTSIQIQKLRWPHVLADEVQKPLLDTMREYHDYVFPQNECIEPFFLVRQSAVLGLWLSDVVDHFGMEPQSWFWEGAGFQAPGRYGPLYESTLDVPPGFYRPLILINAMTGGTVYSFEPYWDLWNEVNGHIGRDVIYPTMLELIRNRLIPSKEEVLTKTKVAYQMNYCKTLEEFHVNIDDVEPLAGKGLLSRAAYGLYWRGQNYEIIPDISRYFFIPLLPWDAQDTIKDRFSSVLHSGEINSVEGYRLFLNHYYPPPDSGDAFVASIGKATYVIQTCENLYREQIYRIRVPQWVATPEVEINGNKVMIAWDKVSGSTAYEIYILENPGEKFYAYQFRLLETVSTNRFESYLPDRFGLVYGIKAVGSENVILEGKVNYLDSPVFLKDKSPLRYVVRIGTDHTVNQFDLLHPGNDTRPKDQTVWPTYPHVSERYMTQAKEIVSAYEDLMAAYEKSDWRGVMAFYAHNYRDPNGYSRKYVGRALKWWFERNQHPYITVQVRDWDFSAYADKETVNLKLWTLWRAIAIDDGKWGDHGLVKFPRHPDQEVWFTWKKINGHWQIMTTDPAVPNFSEILWNARGYETKKVLVPSID
jgi:hypothetical protein